MTQFLLKDRRREGEPRSPPPWLKLAAMDWALAGAAARPTNSAKATTATGKRAITVKCKCEGTVRL